MLWFDILCASLAFTLFFAVTPSHGAKVIALQFVIQFAIDVIFIDLKLHQFVPNWWFYLVKGLVLTGALICVIKHYKPSLVVFLLFSTMLYQFGLWWEEIAFIYSTGIFNRFFLPYMLLNSTLHILFLSVNTNAGRAAKDSITRICHRFWTYFYGDWDLRVPYYQDGGT